MAQAHCRGAGGILCVRRRLRAGSSTSARAQLFGKRDSMDDEEETYRLWKIRKTIMQVIKREELYASERSVAD